MNNSRFHRGLFPLALLGVLGLPLLYVAKVQAYDYSQCSNSEDCDDGLYCNGSEVCNDGGCENGPSPCGDGQTCDEDSNQCYGAGPTPGLTPGQDASICEE